MRLFELEWKYLLKSDDFLKENNRQIHSAILVVTKITELSVENLRIERNYK